MVDPDDYSELSQSNSSWGSLSTWQQNNVPLDDIPDSTEMGGTHSENKTEKKKNNSKIIANPIAPVDGNLLVDSDKDVGITGKQKHI